MMSTIYLAGGCFWGLQKFFDQFRGVIATEVGYANGPEYAPSYQEVCRSSGHAETVKVEYDPAKLKLTELLNDYFMVIDPVSVNRQGNDTGIQYRTGIYYTDPEQLPEIERVYKEQEQKAGVKLAVELEPLKNFFSAEEYHQKYLDKNPGGYCHIPERFYHLGGDEQMVLYDGRPEDVSGRLPREVRTYDYLDALHIPYKRIDHGRADNMEACNEIDAVLGVLICKNLFLCNRQKTKFYMLMMPGDKKFKTKELSSQIHSARLSFADAEAMLTFLDIEPGAVSIMGLMNDKENAVQLLIDVDVLKGEYIGCHPCVCTSSLKIRTADIVEKYLPATGHEYMTVYLVG